MESKQWKDGNVLLRMLRGRFSEYFLSIFLPKPAFRNEFSRVPCRVYRVATTIVTYLVFVLPR